jgi:hypothetical protein
VIIAEPLQIWEVEAVISGKLRLIHGLSLGGGQRRIPRSPQNRVEVITEHQVVDHVAPARTKGVFKIAMMIIKPIHISVTNNKCSQEFVLLKSQLDENLNCDFG